MVRQWGGDMLLGKQYTRIRRRLNARIDVTFEDDEGKRIELPRKMRMLIAVSFRHSGGKVNKKALERERRKWDERRKDKRQTKETSR